MAIHVEVKEQYSKAPAGQYQGVCTEVLDLGYKNKVYKNRETGADEPRNVHEIQYVFQLNKIDPETGKRFEIRSQPLNLNLSDKATLRSFLRMWRGHDLAPAEMKPPGVDVDLTGRNALIQVIHNESSGKTYANIGSIMPLMEGMPTIEALNYQSRQAAVNEAQAKAQTAGPSTHGANGYPTPQPVVDAVTADVIPF